MGAARFHGRCVHGPGLPSGRHRRTGLFPRRALLVREEHLRQPALVRRPSDQRRGARRRHLERPAIRHRRVATRRDVGVLEDTAMHTRMTVLSMMWVLAAALAPAAHADEEATARVREMLRRTQEALRQAQADNAELTRAKTEAEQKLQATTKDLEAARGVSKAEVALRGELQTTKAAQDDLQHRLSDAATALGAANRKESETAKQLAAREAELAQVKQG